MLAKKTLKTIKIILGGSNITTFKTEAKTFGEFKQEIKGELKLPSPHTAMLAETASGLFDVSLLPDEVIYEGVVTNTYHIYIMPVRSKSGTSKHQNITYKECKTLIKGIRTRDIRAVEFFGNYTHASTQAMRDLLDKWYEVKPTKKEKAEKKKKKLKKADTPKIIETEQEIPTDIEVVKKSIVIETNLDVIELLKDIITFLDSTSIDTNSKVIFSMNKVSAEDYDRFKKMVDGK